MSQLLEGANLPQERMEVARLELWQAHWKTVDPVIAGALRLTVQSPLEQDDAMLLERLAATGQPRAVTELCGLLASRCDERPGRYSVSNSADLVRADTDLVRRINAVLSRIKGGLVGDVPVSKRPDSPRAPSRTSGSKPIDLRERIEAEILEDFAYGLEGVSQIISALRIRPYDPNANRWGHDHLANALGFRLVELVDAGLDIEVESAVRLLATALTYTRDGVEFLNAIAQGFEFRGHSRLAALAHTLSWTTQRGGSGWQTFGGEKGIGSLQRANELDPEVASSAIGSELQRIVTGAGAGLYGVTEGLLYALDSTTLGVTGVDAAGRRRAGVLEAWDEAAAVIGARLPRVSGSDDPDYPYTFCDAALDEPALERALTHGVLAALGHPSREQKRRALVAVTILATERPSTLKGALGAALTHLREPITLGALLQILVDTSDGARKDIVGACASALRDLATSPHLGVRSLARDLLASGSLELPPLPVTNAGFAINGAGDRAGRLVNAKAGRRIASCADEIPELKVLVESAVARAIDTDAFGERIKAQRDALTSRSDPVWPNAILADSEYVEDALQRVAGAGRAMRAAKGRLVADPESWERWLARKVLNNPQLAVSLEMVREPRPALEQAPREGDHIWSEIIAAHGGDAAAGSLQGARASKSQLSATVRLASADATPLVESGKSLGWRVVASVETRAERTGFGAGKKVKLARMVSAIERRGKGITRGLECSPLARGEMRVWFEDGVRASAPLGPIGPLIGEDPDCNGWGDNESGMGLQEPALAPIQALVTSLHLRPTEGPLELCDNLGPALRLRLWRTSYIEGDYELTRPTLWGAQLLLRPDSFEVLCTKVSNCVWREFVIGSRELAD
ncbi:MAG: hypothetical protein HOV80_15645 [Polyangiaceae bacterium]|nr:hypothetical protein [Polyangiaceae bacterium]